ncbi:AraC family transcriptional regulator [Aeromonas veronii]|uniref:AraC family transcriptional regulator n=1 Tax=Aeromonas veronii TaxID=654 RepID=A0A3A9J1L7_AERVE|nr:AraC family transcriptional regulator [Aeromonas veronii]RKJ88957.1 AraC family transcriptional regulator [Aeromonas veronii]
MQRNREVHPMNTAKSTTIDDYTQDILNWIDTHLNEQPCLDRLADRLGYSIRMIQQHFKKKYGMTIGVYIQHRRIYRACVLLRMTNLPVGEIACMLHYDNHHNFCRAFKKKLHCTPTAFRDLPQELLPSIPLPQIHYKEGFTYRLITLTNKTLYGSQFTYEEKFLGTSALGESTRLQRLQSWFRDGNTTTTIASEIIRDNSSYNARNEIIIVDALIGRTIDTHLVTDLPANTSDYILDGEYLCCPFYGTLSEYTKHNRYIYNHLLPRLHLRRREGRDIEFFHFTHHLFDTIPKVLCEHFIPIVNDNDASYTGALAETN